jgi:hypothetical protein
MKRLVFLLLSTLMMTAMVYGAAPIEVTILPYAEYSEGVYETPAVNVPTGYTLGYIKINREEWLDPATRITWSIELSQDSGANWQTIVSAGSDGGLRLCPSSPVWRFNSCCAGPGAPLTCSLVGTSLLQADNPNRQVRGTVTVIGGPVTTIVSAGAQ